MFSALVSNLFVFIFASISCERNVRWLYYINAYIERAFRDRTARVSVAFEQQTRYRSDGLQLFKRGHYTSTANYEHSTSIACVLR